MLINNQNAKTWLKIKTLADSGVFKISDYATLTEEGVISNKIDIFISAAGDANLLDSKFNDLAPWELEDIGIKLDDDDCNSFCNMVLVARGYCDYKNTLDLASINYLNQASSGAANV